MPRGPHAAACAAAGTPQRGRGRAARPDAAAAGGISRPAADPPCDRAVWEAILSQVAGARRVLLVLHVRPDGDSVGCSLAVARCLRALGKEPVVVAPEPLPPNLAFLDPQGACVPPAAAAGPFDLALLLDCADQTRLGAARDLVAGVACVVNLDHHPSNTRYGHLNLVDPGAAACAEIALQLIDGLGAPIDAAVATALYAALATDTGSFRYANTSPRTLSMAARLRAAGADLPLIGGQIWENRSLGGLRLLARVLQTLEVDASGELAWITVTAEDLAISGAGADATEGLVDYPRTVRGVEVAVLFSAERPGEVRVSLRSKRRVDVSALAAAFGGGGHARAAGCTLAGDLSAARARVLAAAQAALRAERPDPR